MSVLIIHTNNYEMRTIVFTSHLCPFRNFNLESIFRPKTCIYILLQNKSENFSFILNSLR